VNAATRYDHTAVLTLALDTTTRAGSVAVVRDASLLAVIHGDARRTHGERLPADIERALSQAGMRASELQLLAVASGPGAFTGLRIGLAAIQGLAMVLNLPVIAVSALDALALSVLGTSVPGADLRPHAATPVPGVRPHDAALSPAITAWIDAQRGEVFAASYSPSRVDDTPSPTSVPIVSTPEVALAAWHLAPGTIFVGDGAVRYREQILHGMGTHCRVVDAPPALAPFIAQLGVRRAIRGEAAPPHALQPLYVRRPDAELERQRRGVR
jgi:tRNA threonylcarbamoyladenosine biosynthesis protein TsaB